MANVVPVIDVLSMLCMMCSFVFSKPITEFRAIYVHKVGYLCVKRQVILVDLLFKQLNKQSNPSEKTTQPMPSLSDLLGYFYHPLYCLVFIPIYL